MPQIQVTDRSGRVEALEIQPGSTLMQTISDAGIADLLALCGGVCSCATCHVYVDGAGAELLPPVSDDESALLDSSEYRQGNSRLSCQIRLTPAMDGLRAAIAPAE